MWPLLLLGIYCLLIVAASLAGGLLPQVLRLSHTRMQTIMSFVAGVILGVALLGLLPHAMEESGSAHDAALWLLAGILLMFFLVRAFHAHSHDLPPEMLAEEEHQHDHFHAHPDTSHPEHRHADHSHHDHAPPRGFGWVGVFFGFAVHTLIDGVALGTSVAAATHTSGEVPLLLGLNVFLAVILHKPLDALSITSTMAVAGWPPTARMIANLAFSAMCPLGAVLFYTGVTQWAGDSHAVLGAALAFSAGVFICIALGDILPELHFHHHDRLKLSAALLLGLAVAYGVTLLHTHDYGPDEDHHHDHHHHHHSRVIEAAA